MKILVVNGPNLNFLGIRDKSQYGENSYEYLCEKIKEKADELGLLVEFYQSNIEGEIINKLQEAYKSVRIYNLANLYLFMNELKNA